MVVSSWNFTRSWIKMSYTIHSETKNSTQTCIGYSFHRPQAYYPNSPPGPQRPGLKSLINLVRDAVVLGANTSKSLIN